MTKLSGRVGVGGGGGGHTRRLERWDWELLISRQLNYEQTNNTGLGGGHCLRVHHRALSNGNSLLDGDN